MKNRLTSLLTNTYTQPDLAEKLRHLTTKTEGLEEIKRDIEKLPLVTITLAVAPPKKEINRLGQWFRRNVHPRAILDIHQNPQIIGGCRIIWRGREGDFSLRRKLQKND